MARTVPWPPAMTNPPGRKTAAANSSCCIRNKPPWRRLGLRRVLIKQGCLGLTCCGIASSMFPEFREGTFNPVPILMRLNMKTNKLTYLLVLGLVMTLAATGCKKRPGYLTQIPGTAGTPQDQGMNNLPPGQGEGGIPTGTLIN